MRYSLILCLSAAAAGIGCQNSNIPCGAEGVRALVATPVDAVSGAPIANATFSVVGVTWQYERHITVAAVTGYPAILANNIGTYTVTVQAVGYRTSTTTLTVDATQGNGCEVPVPRTVTIQLQVGS